MKSLLDADPPQYIPSSIFLTFLIICSFQIRIYALQLTHLTYRICPDVLFKFRYKAVLLFLLLISSLVISSL